jgi:chitodextrinase
MKKIISIGVALMLILAARGGVQINAPSNVNSGVLYDVGASADGSAHTVASLYREGAMVDSGENFEWWSVNLSYQGQDTGNKTVHFDAYAEFDVGGWNQWSDSTSHDVVVTVPNTAPAIEWVVNPANAPVGEIFNIQAKGTDSDGNLVSVNVWREGVPFAFHDGGDGFVNFTNLNGASLGYPGTVSFTAQAQDSNGAQSPLIEWVVNVYQPNRSPDSPTISSGGVTQINLGQSVSISGTLHDPDGNLVYHNLYRAAPGGGWVEMLSGAPSNGTNSSIAANCTPTALGYWQFMNWGYDAENSPGPEATFSVMVVDGTPPSIPGGLTSSSITGTSFTLNWNASSDNVGVTVYEVRRDSTSLGTTGAISLGVSGLVQGTAYSMTVRAKDAAGNWSDWSTPLVVTTADTQPPSVPTVLAASNVTGTSFTLSWNASTDNFSVTGYEVMQDSTSLGTISGTSLPVTGLAQGTPYSMTVRARDAAGNWSNWSAPLVVGTADTQPPSVPAGLASNTVTGTSFTLTWNPSTDNFGVTGYEVRRDSTSLGTTSGTSLPITGLSAGNTYSMTVRACDAAGNWSGWSSPLVVTTTAVDTQPPSVPTNLAATGIGLTSFTLTWSASTDNVGVTGYEVMKGATLAGAPAVTSLNVTGLSPGTGYSMTVRARDAGGNWSGWSVPLIVTTTFTGDTDGDGVPDLIEQQLGTNPNASPQNDSANQSALNLHRPTP